MELRILKDKASEAFSKGRFSKAAELYEDYCRAEPKDHQSRLRTGDAWVKAGQKGRAISAYQSAAEGFAREGFLPRAIAASKLILELDPAHRGVQQMLADLYARRGTPVGPRARGPLSNGSSVSSPPPASPPPNMPAVADANPVADAMPASPVADAKPVADAMPASPVADAKPVADAMPSSPVADANPAFLDGEGAGLDLSAELPPELAISLGAEDSSQGREEVVHSVHMGLPHEAGASEHEFTLDIESAAEAAPVVQGQLLPAAVSEDARVTAPEPVPTRMAVREPASPPVAARIPAVQPGGARPATSALPPGLAPRSSQKVPSVGTGRSVSNSGRWQALSSPIGDQSPASPAPVPAPLPPPAEAQDAAGARVLPGHDLTSALGASLRTPQSRSAFTELELEADSLLHAVELAAQAGLGFEDAEEEVFSLTEEVPPGSAALETLPTIPLFSDLPRDAFIELFERCPLRRFGPGERIIEQGSHGDAFYVICEGAVRVFRTDEGQRQDLATLEGGTFFGEMALLSGAARTASVESASEDTQLLEISASVLAELSRSHPQVARALKKFCRQRMLTNVLNTSELFKLFGRKDRRELVERFRSRDVERDAVIIRDGDVTDGLYVVLSGEVEVRKDGHLLTMLKEGDVFGEISLLQKTPATATVTATRHTTLLRLPRADFDTLMSSHPQILAMISDLSDERLRRTQRVLTEAGVEEDIILV
ncbi:PKA regulatory subunit-like protein [Myxococcus hansupus]|uniref:PKA regulatory subunit-like protein n=1 Tax=Pseudomyxococcus hansupus TaxID=1297742 RepID=A0A0H4WXV5_9BACT|nr:cyclic nucleotide-binding domain-containing protein [Myxococcus hansupus]AKQ66170.1 PKA regulatory subunit-like protein [Myxococcus hansupus]